jgi:hypothetical protein
MPDFMPARRRSRGKDLPMRFRTVAVDCALLLMLVVAGCGGSEPGTLVPANTSPGGIWQGTDSGTGLQVSGLIDEKGDFHFIRSDLAQFVGTASSTNDSVTASFEGYAQFGQSFDDGSTHGTGTLSGVLAPRSTLKVSYTFTTDLGTASSGTLDLSYNSLYDVDSSLAAIAGNYTDPSTGDTVSVTATGAVSSQDPTTSCVLNGQVTLIDTHYNAYQVTYSYASCTGASAVLNGVQFNGLATLNNGQSPIQLVVAVTATSGTTKLALVLTLDHQ